MKVSWQKLRVEQNKCVKLLNRTSPLDNLYKNYRILKLDEVIDLEFKKFGYKVYRNLLPKNLLHEVRTDLKGSSLTKNHSYNTRNKNKLKLTHVPVGKPTTIVFLCKV